jgi:hypothetical protein
MVLMPADGRLVTQGGEPTPSESPSRRARRAAWQRGNPSDSFKKREYFSLKTISISPMAKKSHHCITFFQ